MRFYAITAEQSRFVIQISQQGENGSFLLHNFFFFPGEIRAQGRVKCIYQWAAWG